MLGLRCCTDFFPVAVMRLLFVTGMTACCEVGSSLVAEHGLYYTGSIVVEPGLSAQDMWDLPRPGN